jgi:two-component system, chemotaxis family, CheB/CheR fusion protein
MKVELNQALLASVSHEFRTPLNSILNNSIQVAKNLRSEDHADSKICLRLMKSVEVNSKLLICLIDDIVDIAKIEQETFKLQEQPFSLNDLFTEV